MLVRRARAGDPAWTVALAGIAMPGLRRAVGSLAAAWRGDAADLQSEVLTGFLSAVRALDLDGLEAVPLASRLCWAGWRARQEMTLADVGWAARRRDLAEWRDGPDLPWGHPDLVLAANSELQERGLLKHARIATSITAALRERGTDELTARLGAEVGMLAFSVAFGRWMKANDDEPFSPFTAAALSDLQVRTAELGPRSRLPA